MAEHPDVLILGGGVIGLSAAWFLTEAGVRVTIVDKGDFGQQASWAGAGIISPGNPARARTAMDQLRGRSAALYPELSRTLRELTGIDNSYFVCGGLELITRAEDVAADEWRSEGIAFHELTGDELRRRYPYLAPELECAYFLPDLAQVRNPRHVKALKAACASRGVQMRPDCPARRLVRNGGRIEAVETEQGRLTAGRYLIATGAWTDALLGPLGLQPDIRPVRGQIALLNTGMAERRPVLLRGKRYLVPRGDGRLLTGSTEEDAGFDARPTAGAIAGLLDFAAALVPDLADATVERCWAGLRPGSPDGKPFLGVVPGVENLFVAAGHFRAGIQLSPATALVMKEVILGEKPTIALDEFRLDRPLGPPVRTAFQS
ncbi:MAG TPA: glycine oxidase ThiO [Gemmataceae bacterium]|jgi:glycine oxidase